LDRSAFEGEGKPRKRRDELRFVLELTVLVSVGLLTLKATRDLQGEVQGSRIASSSFFLDFFLLSVL